MAANLNFLSLQQKFHGQFRLIRAFHASPSQQVAQHISYSPQLTSNAAQTEAIGTEKPLASTSQAEPPCSCTHPIPEAQ